MSNLQLLLAIFCVSSTSAEDPSEVDYCKTCGTNPATKHKCCNTKRNCIQIEDDINDFRNFIVEEHNMYRRKVVTSDHNYGNLNQTVSKMDVMNYDLELEYLALCIALECNNLDSGGDDICLKSNSWLKIGQNIHSYPTDYYYSKDITVDQNPVKQWFSDGRYIPKSLPNQTDILLKYQPLTPQEPYDRFTQFAWSSNSHVGCARTFDPREELVYTVCVYGSNDEAGNTEGKPVFPLGELCTGCVTHSECSKKLVGLCGTLNATPNEPLVMPPLPQGVPTETPMQIWPATFEDITPKSLNIKTGACGAGRDLHQAAGLEALLVLSLALIFFINYS